MKQTVVSCDDNPSRADAGARFIRRGYVDAAYAQYTLAVVTLMTMGLDHGLAMRICLGIGAGVWAALGTWSTLTARSIVTKQEAK